MRFSFCGGSSLRKNLKLQAACRDGDLARVERYLKEGSADVNVLTESGENLLHLALEAGHDNVALYLLKQGGIDATKPTSTRDEFWPLHAACFWGRDHVVKTLLELHPQQASMETPRQYETPLSLGARQGHTTTVKLLLQAQNGAAAADPRGKALRAASQQGNLDIVRALVSQCQQAQQISRLNQPNEQTSETALFLAVTRGHLSVAHVLHHAGADPVVRNKQEETLLHVAAKEGHLDCVAWLLQQHNVVDVNALDVQQRTALYWACKNGHQSVAQKLLQAGADLFKGKSPAVGAAVAGHVPVLQLLQQELEDDGGLLPGPPKKNTRTIVHMAAQHGKLAAVKYLIQDAGGSVQAADDRGFTPLHHAAAGNHDVMVSWLLQEGADINATTYAGETAMDLASYKHYSKAIRALKHFVPVAGDTFVGEQSTVSFENDQEEYQPLSQYDVMPQGYAFDTSTPSSNKVAPLPPMDPTEFSEADGEESFISHDETLVTGSTSALTAPTWPMSLDRSYNSALGLGGLDRFKAEREGSSNNATKDEDIQNPARAATVFSRPAATKERKTVKRTSKQAKSLKGRDKLNKAELNNSPTSALGLPIYAE